MSYNYNYYPPPTVDESGKYAWETNSASSASAFAPPVDPNAFDYEALGYAKPEARRDDGCRVCGKPGHMGRDCPTKRGGYGAGNKSTPLPPATIYVSGLSTSITEAALAKHFGSIGLIAKDKKNFNADKIKIYPDPATGQPKGDALITYEDPSAAAAAVEWFNGKEFQGAIISVDMAFKDSASSKAASASSSSSSSPPSSSSSAHSSHSSSYGQAPAYGQHNTHSQYDQSQSYGGHSQGQSYQGAHGGYSSAAPAPAASSSSSSSGSRDGEWICPGCNNNNFSKRMECFRCKAPRPAHLMPKSSGGFDNKPRPSFAKEGDWNCQCGNINFHWRDKCNECNRPKPGSEERRTGRAGGFSERDTTDEAEKLRRRRDAESSEQFDEYGRPRRGGRDSYSGSTRDRSPRRDDRYDRKDDRRDDRRDEYRRDDRRDDRDRRY